MNNNLTANWEFVFTHIARSIATHTPCKVCNRINFEMGIARVHTRHGYSLPGQTNEEEYNLWVHTQSKRLIALPFYQFVIRSIERCCCSENIVNAMLSVRMPLFKHKGRINTIYVIGIFVTLCAIKFRCHSIYRSIFAEWIFQHTICCTLHLNLFNFVQCSCAFICIEIQVTHEIPTEGLKHVLNDKLTSSV